MKKLTSKENMKKLAGNENKLGDVFAIIAVSDASEYTVKKEFKHKADEVLLERKKEAEEVIRYVTSELYKFPNIKCEFVPITKLINFIETTKEKPDVVVWLVENRLYEECIYQDRDQIVSMKHFLKRKNIPVTGCTGLALYVEVDKSLQASIAESMGVPFPKQNYVVWDNDNYLEEWIRFPAFVKACYYGDSIGLRDSSVVLNKDELRKEVARLREIFPKETLVLQEYLSGAEYTVGIIGNSGTPECRVLPIIHIDFGLNKSGGKFLTSMAKNSPSSSQYMQGSYKIALNMDPKIRKSIEESSLKIYQHLKGKGYARADWRIDANGQPKFLEMNTNPDIRDETSSILKMFRHETDGTFGDFIVMQIMFAIEDAKQKEN